MPIGITETATVADSLPAVVAKATQIREQEGVMPQLVSQAKLKEGTGLTHREVRFARLSDATTVSEGDEFDSPQQLSDALVTGTPVEVGIEIIITDRVKQRIDKKALAQTGGLIGHAIQRKKAKDGIVQLDSFSTSPGGSGTVLASGYITAAVDTIEGNATERGVHPIYSVHHHFQRRALTNDLAPVGTYPNPEGLTSNIIRDNFSGPLGSAQVFFDSVVAPDTSGDFKGGTFAKESIVLVQGYELFADEERLKARRATAMFMFDEYIYLERFDSGGVEMFFDSPTPTT